VEVRTINFCSAKTMTLTIFIRTLIANFMQFFLLFGLLLSTSLRMQHSVIFTSPLHSLTPISCKTRQFWQLGYKQGLYCISSCMQEMAIFLLPVFTIMFLHPNFLRDANILAIPVYLRQI